MNRENVKKYAELLAIRLVQNAYKSGINNVLPLIPERNHDEILLRFLNKKTEEEMPLSIKIDKKGVITLYQIFKENPNDKILSEIHKFDSMEKSFQFESLSKLFKNLITTTKLNLNYNLNNEEETKFEFSSSRKS
jgi:hypothetical protein